MAPPRSKRRRGLLVGVLSTLLLIGITGLVTWLVGYVEGREFAATHFTTRSFSFWELPIVHLQVTPIRHESVTTPGTNYLRSNRLVSVPNSPPAGWHLVEIRRGLRSPAPADAEILIGHLELTDQSGSPYWEEWSKSHPHAAQILWPMVQRLAIRELYVLLPDLFEVARRQTDPAKLNAALDDHLRTAYLQLAVDLRDAGRPALALETAREGLADFPDDSELDQLVRSLDQSNSPQTESPQTESP